MKIRLFYNIIPVILFAPVIATSQYNCDYSSQVKSVSSEACVYNKMYSYSSTDTLAKQLVIKILNIIFLTPNFSIEPCEGINTCRAYVYDNGVRYIFYDPKFVDKITDTTKNDWALIGVLAHELGHHLLGHTLIKSDDMIHRQNELQADEFSGSMLAKMGASDKQVLLALNSVAHPACKDELFNSYPCYENRKTAVLSGYNKIFLKDREANFILSKNLASIDISSFPTHAAAKPLGLSVSAFSNQIDSTFIINNNIKFLFIKATQGSTSEDKGVNKNVELAKKLNISYSLYHLFTPNSSAEKQAKNFNSVYEKYGSDLPVVIDLEEISNKVINKNTYVDSVLKFISSLNVSNKDSIIIYTSPQFAKQYLDNRLGKYKLFVALFSKNYNPSEGVSNIWNKADYWHFKSSNQLDLIINNQ